MLGRVAFLFTAAGLNLAFRGVVVSLAAIAAAWWPAVGWVISGVLGFVALLQLADRSFRRFNQDSEWRRWDDLAQGWLNAGESFRAEVSGIANRLGVWGAGLRIALIPGKPMFFGPPPGAPDDSLRWKNLQHDVARWGSSAVQSPARDGLVVLMGEAAVALPADQRQATQAWAIARAIRLRADSRLARLFGIEWLLIAGAFALIAVLGPPWWVAVTAVLVVIFGSWVGGAVLAVRVVTAAVLDADREAAQVVGAAAVVGAISALNPDASASPPVNAWTLWGRIRPPLSDRARLEALN